MALQVLYENDLTRHQAGDILTRRLSQEVRDDGSREEIRRMVAGVIERLGDIDVILQRSAPAWPLSQMPGVDKAALRLAIFEAIFDNSAAPVKVVISEAVELARAFGSESSAKFVTGVMGTVTAREGPR